MAGIPTELPLVLRESLGSSDNLQPRTTKRLNFRLSARRSFGRAEHIPCRKERQSLTPPQPGLNAGAYAHHGVKKKSISPGRDIVRAPSRKYSVYRIAISLRLIEALPGKQTHIHRWTIGRLENTDGSILPHPAHC